MLGFHLVVSEKCFTAMSYKFLNTMNKVRHTDDNECCPFIACTSHVMTGVAD